MTIGLWISLPPRPDMVASYALRVPQTGDLLTASFRPRLTAAALTVRLTVPVIRVRRGLSPPSGCALPGAQNKRQEPLLTPASLKLTYSLIYLSIPKINFGTTLTGPCMVLNVTIKVKHTGYSK